MAFIGPCLGCGVSRFQVGKLWARSPGGRPGVGFRVRAGGGGRHRRWIRAAGRDGFRPKRPGHRGRALSDAPGQLRPQRRVAARRRLALGDRASAVASGPVRPDGRRPLRPRRHPSQRFPRRRSRRRGRAGRPFPVRRHRPPAGLCPVHGDPHRGRSRGESGSLVQRLGRPDGPHRLGRPEGGGPVPRRRLDGRGRGALAHGRERAFRPGRSGPRGHLRRVRRDRPAPRCAALRHPGAGGRRGELLRGGDGGAGRRLRARHRPFDRARGRAHSESRGRVLALGRSPPARAPRPSWSRRALRAPRSTSRRPEPGRSRSSPPRAVSAPIRRKRPSAREWPWAWPSRPRRR